MEMRVKHLQKMGEVAKAVVLAKACTECSFISNQATFHQTYVSLLCHLLPNEEAINEVFIFEKHIFLSGHDEWPQQADFCVNGASFPMIQNVYY